VDLYVDPTADEKFKTEVEKNDNITGFEAEYRRLDGITFWAREHIHIVRDEHGTPLFYEGSLIDITASKRVEEEIRQRLSELEVLYQSSIALSQLVNPKVIAQNIIDLLDQKMDWHHSTIRLYHPQDETLELLAFNHPNLHSEEERRTVEERFRTIIVKKGQGLSGWVVQYDEVVRTGDLQNDLRYVETFPGLQSGLYVPIKIAERIIGVISIESEKPDAFSKSDERLTITLAAQAAIAINNAQLFDDLQGSNISLTSAYDATIEGWSRAMDLRDKETEGHTLRVTDLTLKLARAMHIGEESQLTSIRRGALLHDIGKMGVPDRILLKPGTLNPDEWKIMRRHPTYAYEMLTPIAYLQAALDIPYCHHEKWDGTGYPRGLKGEQIPLEARIFAIVDVWDAITSDRPYRPAWSKQKALEYIQQETGKHFDPQVVETFFKMMNNQ
jgi:putative nucleotidyltransferase with HDIG domain